MSKHDGKSPLKPGATKLSSVWKRFAVTTALAAVLVGCETTPTRAQIETAPQPQNTEQQADTVMKPRPKPPKATTPAETAEQKALREGAEHVLIRRALIADARIQFAAANLLPENAYSLRLDSMQQSLTLRLQMGDTSMHNRVVVLDPRKFDVGMALGLGPQMTIRLMLGAQHVTADSDVIEGAAENMAGSYNSPYGRIFTQKPSAFTNVLGRQAQACVLVPSSDHAIPYAIAGLTHAQKLTFINKHESWHCLDARYSFRDIDQKELEWGMNSPIPAASETVRRYLSIMYKKEALADIGALGDMIRQEGMDTSIIDAGIAWRLKQQDDFQHMSVPVLEGLRAKIDSIGIGAFRAMGDLEVTNLYFDLTDARGLNPKMIEYLVQLAMTEEQPEARAALDLKYGGDPEYRKTVDFVKYFDTNSAAAPQALPLPPQLRVLTPAEVEIYAAVTGWPSGKILLDRAFEHDGKITPKTLVNAYGKIQNELQAQMGLKPEDPVPPLLMAKLQQTFVNGVTTLDYVEVNRLRGVDIAAVEPSLIKFRHGPVHLPELKPAPAAKALVPSS